jgi:hypothetical protein
MAQGGYIDLPPFHVHHNIRVQTTAIGSHAAWSCISSASQGVLIQALSDHETTVPGMAMVINTATQWYLHYVEDDTFKSAVYSIN